MADISKIKLPNGSEYNIKSLRVASPNEIIPLQTKTYSSFVASGNSDPAGWYYFATVNPTSNDYTKLIYVKYRIRVTAAGRTDSYTDSIVEYWFYNNAVLYYRTSNSIKSTSYRPFYNHIVFRAKQAGLTAGYGHLLGIRMQSSWNPTTSANSRTVQVDILETMDCNVSFFDSMTLYANVPGTGSTNYDGRSEYNGTDQGDRHTGDANDTTTLQFSTAKLTAGTNGIPAYSVVMMLPDGKWEGLTVGNATAATTSTKNTHGFVLGEMYLYWSGTNIAAGATTGTSVIRTVQDWVDFRYTSNCGTTLTSNAMIYLKGTVTNGLFYLADTWWTQTLPTSNDGFVYIPVGMCYGNGYSFSFWGWNGAYYHNGTTLVEYVGDAKSVNGHTVAKDVPSDAKFTDTVTTAITSGSGNAVTAISASNGALTVTKGTTFLTSHQDISGKTNISVLPNDNGEIKTKFRISNKGNTGSASTAWYFPLIKLPKDDSGNYASLILSGRIGGWVDSNMSYIQALVWNRGSTGIALLDIAGTATAMSSIWGICDIVVYTNSDNTDTVYLLAKSYYTFDIDIELFQSTASILYDGTYSTTTPSGTLNAQASTSTKRVEIVNGKFLVSGTDLSVVSNLSGTLGVSHGGTGQTTAQAAANSLLGALDNTAAQSTAPTDDTSFITTNVTGTTGTYYHRKASLLWDYIKSKFSGTSPINFNNGTISHANSGVTAASKGDTSNQTPAFGDTFKVPSGTVNATGHLTAFADHTVKIPDTKASTSAYGITKLSTSTSSTATDLAATPSAVKTAYDLAYSANGTANSALSGVQGTLIYDHTYTIANGVASFAAHVYCAGEEVTNDYADSCFTWSYRLAINMDGTPSIVSLGTGKTVSINISAIGYGASIIGTFTPPSS